MLKIANKYQVAIVILFLSIIPIFKFRELLFQPVDINSYGKKYGESQYILGDKAVQKIDDSELYVYASYAYVQGQDPSTINFEHPPLAKYFYGLFYLIFENPYSSNIFLYPLLLTVFYYFSKTILKREKSRIIALFFFGSLPLLTELMRYILLDIPFLIALLTFLLILGTPSQKLRLKYLLAGLTLGVIASIKYPIPFIFVPSIFLLVHSFINKQLKFCLLSFITAGVLYIVQYSVYFVYHPSLLEFLKFEKYRFDWWTSYRTAPKFLIFSNLFFGQYKAWWADGLIQYSKEWTISIPILFIGHVYSFIKTQKYTWLLELFTLGVLLLLLYGYGSAAELRYLLQIIPIWIIILIKYFEKDRN